MRFLTVMPLKVSLRSLALCQLACCVGCSNSLSRLSDNAISETSAISILSVNVLRPERTENASEIVVCFGQFIPDEDGSPLVEVNLANNSAVRLADGQRIWIGHDGKAVRTRIKQRSPLQGPMPGERLLLQSEEPIDAQRWAAGDVVEIRSRASISEGGFWLPISALHRTANMAWSVLTAVKSESEADQWSVKRVECRIIAYEDNRVLVEAAELEGAVVIADGSHRIVPGQVVTFGEVKNAGATAQSKGDQ